MKKPLIALLLIFIIFNLNSCTEIKTEAPKTNWPTGDWITLSPEDVQMNSTILDEFRRHTEENLFSLNGLIIIRNGYLVLEEYFRGWDADQAHELYSTTKSVSSALVGIAVDQGLFSVNDSVLDFFPEYTFNNVDSRKQNITVENLLNMKSGLNWDEWSYNYFHPDNHYNQMLNSPDWIQYILDKPMVTDPGSIFVYCGGASHLLQAIIDRTANISSLEFATQFLFEPLGIFPGPWLSSPNNIVCGAHGLHLTPRDMAKFGYLFMNNGSWKGVQIISKNWVLNSTRVKPSFIYTNNGNPINYGYQWWVQSESFDYYLFYTSGLYGQRIHCFPELDMIFVTTSEFSYDWNFLIQRYVIPSITDYNSSISSSQEDTSSHIEISSDSDASTQKTSVGIIIPICGLLMFLVNRKKR